MKRFGLFILCCMLISISGCKKEEDDLVKLPAWFRNKFWYMTSIEFKWEEVLKSMDTYFKQYSFPYYVFCDILNRCFACANFYSVPDDDFNK